MYDSYLYYQNYKLLCIRMCLCVRARVYYAYRFLCYTYIKRYVCNYKFYIGIFRSLQFCYPRYWDIFSPILIYNYLCTFCNTFSHWIIHYLWLKYCMHKRLKLYQNYVRKNITHMADDYQRKTSLDCTLNTTRNTKIYFICSRRLLD